jgi:hypothetical protein
LLLSSSKQKIKYLPIIVDAITGQTLIAKNPDPDGQNYEFSVEDYPGG